MKKSLKKSLMIILSIIMVFTMGTPVAFAEEPATVKITFANSAIENHTTNPDGLKVTNIVNTSSSSKDAEGTYVGNEIVFEFDTEMDVSTLKPENITIELGISLGMPASETRYDSTSKKWTYTKYNATATTYTIYVSDMCEGVQNHVVTFTSNVKTAEGASINEVVKKFRTGRISKAAPAENKQLVNVAYSKPFVKADGEVKEKWTNWQETFQNLTSHHTTGAASYRIDLGNYYDIADVVLYTVHAGFTFTWDCPIDARYSNDPNATYETALPFGNFATGQYMPTSTVSDWALASGGRGHSRWLHPEKSVRARYVFINCSSLGTGGYGEAINEIRILASVDTDYGAITATKDGAPATTFTGAGEYTVSVPVKEYVSGSSNGHMIVAGYDANGVITKINCAAVSKSDDKLTLSTTFTDATKTVKAVLIKDFTKPQMLTDALVLESAQN